MQKKTSLLYRIIKWLVRLFYPKIQLVGAENIPHCDAVIVGNHCQMNGPIASELYCPGEHYTWCAAEMLDKKEIPAYAFHDFWRDKPRYSLWFYRILSHVIAPLAQCIFTNANVIGVYRDSRIIATFKKSVCALHEGANLVIFPEHDAPYNHILARFQKNFVDVAKLYYRKTGKRLSFVPMYLAPTVKCMCFGAPILYDPNNDPEKERSRICDHLMQTITGLALQLPEHRVVPYKNIPRRRYPSSREQEASVK